MKSIVFNEGIEIIHEAAFAGCSELKEVTLPASVKQISIYAFVYCDHLQKIKFEGNAPEYYIADDSLDSIYGDKLPNCTVYYHEGAEGFTSPEWNGYPTEIW